MNSTTQLEFHPDAESLNAFAEKALPERERGQILAHLAECSRCRQVIFLARQAASDMEMAAVPAAHSTKRSGSWLRGWRLAWIPTAALATVVALAFLVHNRHEETGTEMAKAVLPVAPQNAASNANPTANNRVEARMVHASASPVVAKPPEIKVESSPTGAAYVPVPTEAAPSPAAVNESVTVAAAPPGFETPATASAGSVGQAIGMSQYKPEPIAGAPRTQSVGAIYSNNASAAYAPKAKMDEMEERDQASRKAESRYAGSGGASTTHVKKDVLPHSSFDASAPMPMVQFEAAPEANPATLPSGQTAVSTVTAQNRTLALDQAGALFLSKDSGRNWESVTRQWAGRAVEVRLQRPGSGSPAATVHDVGVATAPRPTAAIFEIVNDKNLIWVSMDGKSWKAQ